MEKLFNNAGLRILATVAFAAMLIVNALANLLPLNDLTTGDVAAIYSSLFTPAGITFSIWSVIYFLLMGFLIHTWIHKNEDHITKLLPEFTITCILNLSWIIAWHHLMPGLSVVVMLLLLFMLIRLFLKVQHIVPRKKGSIFLVIIPFSIYLAWICVATIANISAWLVSLRWNSLSSAPEIWTILMMAVAAVIGIWILLKYRTPEFVAVIVWALLGIYLRWKGSAYEVVQYGSMVLILVLLVITVLILVRKRKSHA